MLSPFILRWGLTFVQASHHPGLWFYSINNLLFSDKKIISVCFSVLWCNWWVESNLAGNNVSRHNPTQPKFAWETGWLMESRRGQDPTQPNFTKF